MPAATDFPPPATRAHPSNRLNSDFERECVEFFAEVVQVLSVPRSLGQIYGLLFASPQPLSFTDIVDRLGISKGSASQGLRLLHELGAVEIVRPGLDHRELFTPELALRKLLAGVIQENIEPFLSSGKSRIQRIKVSAEQVPAGPSEKFARQRVRQLNTWGRQLGLLLPVLKVLLGPSRSRSR